MWNLPGGRGSWPCPKPGFLSLGIMGISADHSMWWGLPYVSKDASHLPGRPQMLTATTPKLWQLKMGGDM